MNKTLLLAIVFPDNEPWLDARVEADDLADAVIAIVNEERERQADAAHRPDYYKPLMVGGIPGPQWVDGRELEVLVRAIRLVQDARSVGPWEAT